jgi:hypothetical protein
MHPMRTVSCPGSNRLFYADAEAPQPKSRFDAMRKRGADGSTFVWRLIGLHESIALRREDANDSDGRIQRNESSTEAYALKTICSSSHTRLRRISD